MLTLQGISYFHPNQDGLFTDLSLSLQRHQKVALVGNNGAGKSILLRIISGELQPASGQRLVETTPYVVPQVFGQFDHLTVAQALGVEAKLHALHQILAGDTGEGHFSALQDDWTIEDRSLEALERWQLPDIGLDRSLSTLSGGQKTKIFLAGMTIHSPGLVLMDEPSNHLDRSGRQLLEDWISSTSSTLLMVSHDRGLLRLLDTVFELDRGQIAVYGGNFDFYQEQKALERKSLLQDLQHKEKELRKAKARERDMLERQHRQNARGRKKQESRGVPKVMMDKMKNDAENSSARLKDVHAEKIGGISHELQGLRESISDIDQMTFRFRGSGLHAGKVLFRGSNLNVTYGESPVWSDALNLEIRSGERVTITGDNGSGKSTLLRLILGELTPTEGEVFRADARGLYIDQEYSLIEPARSIYEQAHSFNDGGLQEHEINIRLSRMLFPQSVWNTPCAALSGGERMRLTLACLNIAQDAPDLIILDEPTNNLDLQNIGILTAAIRHYPGTLIVVSHDATFLKELEMAREIDLGGAT